MDKLQVIELSIDDIFKDGVSMIAFVDNPAIQVDWMAFNEHQVDPYKFQTQSEEKRIVAGAFMIPDMNIYRNMNGKEFMVKFSKETIAQIVDRFMKSGKIAAFNFMHDEKQPLTDVYIQQSFIIDREMGVNPPKDFEFLPDGTWFGFVKVDNDTIWNDFVKTGKLKGFSVEGDFSEKNKFSEQKNTIMNKLEKLFEDVKKYVFSTETEGAPTPPAPVTPPASVEGAVKMGEAQLADGTSIMIEGELAEGSAVMSAEGTPVADGEYTLADGTIIAVQGGLIAMIKTAEQEPDMNAQFEALKAENEALKAELSKYTSTEVFETFAREQKEFNKQIFELAEEIYKSKTTEKIEGRFNNSLPLGKFDAKRQALAENFKKNK